MALTHCLVEENPYGESETGYQAHMELDMYCLSIDGREPRVGKRLGMH